jgi:uncharacterized repeat protein (TIGR02543 family)
MVAKKLITAVAFVLLFWGCVEDDFDEFDGVCPLVVSTVSEKNAIEVPLNQVITAKFNEKMNPSTMAASFTVSSDALIAGTVTYSDSTATFTPSLLLDKHTKYTCTIKKTAKDLKGNALQEDYVWTFTTVLPLEFTVAVSSNPVISGVSSGAGKFEEESEVSVTTVPNANYTFSNWTENEIEVSTDANYDFVLIGNRILIANYTVNQFTINVSSNPAIGGLTSGSGSFDVGTTKTVTANPNAGYTFVNWTEAGVEVSTNASYTFELDSDKTFVANFNSTPQFTINGSSNPAIGGLTSGSGSFDVGSTRTVTGTPNAGYTFVNWTEAGVEVSTNSSYTFELDSDKTFVANFNSIPKFTINLSSSPTIGGLTSGSGLFDIGTRTVAATPNAGYTFVNWTEAGVEVSTSTSYTFVLNSDKTFVANFISIPQFTINVSSNPAIGGLTSGSGSFDIGITRTVTATPNAGYTFVNWTEAGVEVAANASYTFVLDSDKTFVANFNSIPQFTINVSSNPAISGVTSGSGSFYEGTTKTVTATPNTGYAFVNWTDAGVEVSTNANYTFVLDSDKTLVANFISIPQFVINVSSNPSIGGVTDGSGSFYEGTTKTVTATQNSGYTFVSWTEAGVEVSTNSSYSFVLDSDKTLVANFISGISSYSLNVTAVNGSVIKNPNASTYNGGDSVELTATPDPGYEFSSWSGDLIGTDNPITVIMNSNKNITANFTATYSLSVIALNGTVLKNPATETYSEGDAVEITVTPDSGYEFSSWSGDATGTDNPLTVIMNSNKNITANFIAKYSLNIMAVDGTVLKNPDTETYNEGDSVELTATPDSGYEFTSWSGDATGTDNPLTVIMNSNKNITANFTALSRGPGRIDLGAAGDFVILSKSGISTTGTTQITGNIGVSPIGKTALTGFSETLHSSGVFATSIYVVGKMYASNYAVPTPSYLTTAVSDLETAFTTANGLTENVILDLGAGNVSGMTLVPGLYKWGTGLLITNAGVTLSGGANDTWVFQISDDLTVNNDAIITLEGGAQAKNIFWVSSTQVTLGTQVQFKGNILSKALTSLNTGASILGRILAQTASTLDANTVVFPGE